MRLSLCAPLRACQLLLLLPLLLNVSLVSAERIIESSALEVCQTNSSFTASLFDIAFTPDNNSLAINVNGLSSISGNVTLRVQAAAYGYIFLTETLDPCTMGLSSLCPLQNIQISFDAVYNNLSSSVTSKFPAIAYGIPDLDVAVTVNMYATNDPTTSLACARSRLSNGQTVYQAGVGWATAIVAGLGLLTSAFISGLGYSNTASHIALYALALFNYFQAVAIIGFCAVPFPFIVQSWTQNFSWSMGIVRVGFLQRLATWYLLATGGKPATILMTLGTKSVQVLKRSLEAAGEAHALVRRDSSNIPAGEYTVKGIGRVAFRANMELTNLFLTGIIFFCIFVTFTALGVMLFLGVCKLAIRAGWMKRDRFQDFRDDYRVTLKGIILRILLIAYPQIAILSLWEFTQIDSAAEVALAVFMFFGLSAALLWATFNVLRLARRSEQIHNTAAFLLYANAMALNKWGFLYVQFRASAYYYIVAALVYTLIKAMFVAFAQGAGTVQAVAFLVLEAAALIGASVVRPWMDKISNGINISICAINFINAIFLLIFTGVFNGPGLVIGVSGVVFFVVNALFALVLLLIVLTAVGFSVFRGNPETRYDPVADNRASFIKSQTFLTTELDALGASARGLPGSAGHSQNDLHNSIDHNSLKALDLTHGGHGGSYQELHQAPSTPSLPFAPRHSPHIGSESPLTQEYRLASERPSLDSRYSDASPGRRNLRSPDSEKGSWQRGAGYDH